MSTSGGHESHVLAGAPPDPVWMSSVWASESFQGSFSTGTLLPVNRTHCLVVTYFLSCIRSRCGGKRHWSWTLEEGTGGSCSRKFQDGQGYPEALSQTATGTKYTGASGRRWLVVERENLFSQKLFSTHTCCGTLTRAHTNTCKKHSERPATVLLASCRCPVLTRRSGVEQLLMEILVNAFLLPMGRAWGWVRRTACLPEEIKHGKLTRATVQK